MNMTTASKQKHIQKKKRNIVLSQLQVTIDYTFMVPNDVELICRAFVKKKFFSAKHREVLRTIGEFGLRQDYHLRLEPNELADLGGALNYLREKYRTAELAQIGGNSAIAALRGHCLGVRGRDPSLPIVRYAGVYPASLHEYISKQKRLNPVFYETLNHVFDKALCVPSAEKPMTLALEAHHKVIIAYGRGREVGYLMKARDFSGYLKRLKPLVTAQKVLFAFP